MVVLMLGEVNGEGWVREHAAQQTDVYDVLGKIIIVKLRISILR